MDLSLIIRTIRKYLNLSQDDFANKLGLKRSNLSQMEIGRNTPSVSLLNDIANIFRINIMVVFQMINSDEQMLSTLLPQLLLHEDEFGGKENGKVDGKVLPDFILESGKTTSIKSNKNEVLPTSFFVPDSGKTKSINIVEVPVPVGDDSEMVSIPVVDISVAAGSGCYNTDYLSEVDSIRFPRSMVKGGQPHICVRIKGESMVPTLQDGGYLVIRLLDRSEWQYLREGHVYVVSSTEGRAFVKRLKNRFKEHGFIVCMSDNPDPMGYPNFNLMADEINTIWHAEWYISAKMPNIHETYYKKVGELEDKYEGVMEEIQQIHREIKAIARS